MTLTDVIAWTALVIGAISAIVAALQWNSAERSADAAERSAEAAENTAEATRIFAQLAARPWVSVTAVSMIDGSDLRPKYNVALTVENLGKTPAFDLTVDDRLEVIPDPIPDQLPLSNPENPSRYVLGPGKNVTSGCTVNLSASDIDDVYHKRSYLASYGVLSYRDVFQQRHETRWCFYYFGGHGFTVASKHNSAT